MEELFELKAYIEQGRYAEALQLLEEKGPGDASSGDFNPNRDRGSVGEGVQAMQGDWNLLATSSHYNTAVAVHEELRAGNIDNAITGLEELIEALSRSDERAIESYLTRLIQHIIKWKLQPERRTPSWVGTIRYTRRQIRKLQRANPRFTDDWIRAQWNDLLEGAVDEAQTDLGQEIDQPPPLSWTDVFDVEYRVEKRAR